MRKEFGLKFGLELHFTIVQSILKRKDVHFKFKVVVLMFQ